MDQVLINWMLGGFGALIGFMLNVIWQAVKDLQKNDKELADKVAHIEVLVAGSYVKYEQFDQLRQDLFSKLDRIEEKLAHKVDK